MAALKKALESNWLLNLLATGLVLYLSFFFWNDLSLTLPETASNQMIKLVILLLSFFSIYCIFSRRFITLPILFIVFTGCYFLYQLMFAQSQPLWLVLVFLFIILWLVFPLFDVKKKHGIFFFLQILILFEVFLTLGYWLVNPINRSLIMAIVAYLFGGWLTKINHPEEKFSPYIVYSIIAFLIILLTLRWGA